MENSEIHFCKECNNMTYLYLNEDKDLIHYCKACESSELFNGKDNCIYSIDFKEYDNSDYINNNKYISHDITLPKIKNNNNIKCPNINCEYNKENKDNEFTYIKYDLQNMKYIYICNNCGQKWKNN
tara:strand:- start:258 stop:635 length:378 start_codon:yes stop_codon:yes gene_type:complete